MKPGRENRYGPLPIRAGDEEIGTSEMARVLQVTRRRASRILQEGKIPAKLDAGRLRTTRRHVEAYRDARQNRDSAL